MPVARRLVSIAIGAANTATSFPADIPAIPPSKRCRLCEYIHLGDTANNQVAVVRWNLSPDVLGLCHPTIDPPLATDNITDEFATVSYSMALHTHSCAPLGWISIPENFTGGAVTFYIRDYAGGPMTGRASGLLALLLEFE